MTVGLGTRRLALTVHVVASVGWLGAIIAFLALAITGLASDDADVVRAVYIAAEPLTWLVIVPLAVASLATGILQSLVTSWGLVRHYWVVFKLLIAVVATIVLLMYTGTVGTFADRAADRRAGLDELRAPTFVLHSGAALALLLAATGLAVYKPAGVTPYGRRRQRPRRVAAP